jgi:hypothetical protein
MLQTASSLPLTGLSTLGFDPARFQAEPPACYRASWQLPGPDFHRQATTSLRTRRSTMAVNGQVSHGHGQWHYVTVSPPVLLGARKIGVNAGSRGSSVQVAGKHFRRVCLSTCLARASPARPHLGRPGRAD